MRKVINFRCVEEIQKEIVEVEHGIYNWFGKMVSLPSTTEIKLNEINFKPDELGDCFIGIGNMLKKESSNIKNLELKSELRPRADRQGKEFVVAFLYDTCENEGK